MDSYGDVSEETAVIRSLANKGRAIGSKFSCRYQTAPQVYDSVWSRNDVDIGACYGSVFGLVSIGYLWDHTSTGEGLG